MPLTELYNVCAAAGHRVNAEAGTVDGVCRGIAFRLMPESGTVDLSVNIAEKNLQKWQEQLGATATVVYHGFGVRLTVAGLSAMSGEQVLAALDGWTSYASGAAGQSFTDKFQSYREPVAAYFRGAAGAFLGALVGVIPWVLVGALGWYMWLFGSVISVASFYGYQWLRGAHSTHFAVGSIVVSSLLALMVAQVLGTAVDWMLYSEVAMSFGEALAFCFTREGLQIILSDSLFGLLACALGFVGIRGKVMDYTHESGYLRRRK